MQQKTVFGENATDTHYKITQNTDSMKEEMNVQTSPTDTIEGNVNEKNDE